MNRRLPALAAGCVAAAGAGGLAAEPVAPAPEPNAQRYPPIQWRVSRSVGLPYDGRLANGVRLPPEGRLFFTWDPVRKRRPNRSWRRFGSDRLVRLTLNVLAGYRRAHPRAPRVGIGDLSRPQGGDFGARFGGLGHASHQNGLDIDVYYPRRDGRERAPAAVRQIHRLLAQDLVDRFLAAGARLVFVGPNTGLTGPRRRVYALVHHDNHLHVRIPADEAPFCRRPLVNHVYGYRLRVPCTWRAATRAKDGTTLLSGPGAALELQHCGRRPRLAAATRRRVGLGPERLWEGFGRGHLTRFALRDHCFLGFARLDGRARTSKRALAVLRSVRLTARADRVDNVHTMRLLGRSARGRPIRSWQVGNPRSSRKLLVVGCIHGDECAGMAVTRQLLALVRPIAADLWIVQNLNPDGFRLGRRQNSRGVELNRNFPSEWRHSGRRWDPLYPGPRPASEPETRLAQRLIRRIRPDVTIWFHQPQGLVRAWGGSIPAARQYAGLAHMPFRAIRWPPGTAPNWQNHRWPGSSSFVVELPPGPVSPTAARRHARAILAFAA